MPVPTVAAAAAAAVPDAAVESHDARLAVIAMRRSWSGRCVPGHQARGCANNVVGPHYSRDAGACADDRSRPRKLVGRMLSSQPFLCLKKSFSIS